MKTTIKSLIAVIFALSLCSCDSILGKKSPMDSEETITIVKDIVKQNVPATDVKITHLSWNEGEELENNLGNISVSWVDSNNKTYSRYISYNDKGEAVPDEVDNGKNDIFYEFVKGIEVDKLDPATIIKQFNDAKPLIGDEYKFKSVGKYSIFENTLSMSFKETHDKVAIYAPLKAEDYGQCEVKFKLNVLKKGEGTEQTGRVVTTNFYEVPFIIAEDGSVQINENQL